jgi:hypothetical protein
VNFCRRGSLDSFLALPMVRTGMYCEAAVAGAALEPWLPAVSAGSTGRPGS